MGNLQNFLQIKVKQLYFSLRHLRDLKQIFLVMIVKDEIG